MLYIRENILYKKELKDIAIADLVLTIAFSLIMIGGIGNLASYFGIFVYFIPISFVAVSLSFVLHELMHKFTAERYGAIAGFRTSPYGLTITLISSFLGFLIGIPGATIIYTHTFTKREDGIVSIAGPLTNFAIFLVFLAVGLALFPNFLSNVLQTFSSSFHELPYLQNMVNMVLFVNIYLAFFNMLPIYPLDGSKVLRWNKLAYLGIISIIFLLFALVLPIQSIIAGLLFMLIFAYLFSLFYRGLLF